MGNVVRKYKEHAPVEYDPELFHAALPGFKAALAAGKNFKEALQAGGEAAKAVQDAGGEPPANNRRYWFRRWLIAQVNVGHGHPEKLTDQELIDSAAVVGNRFLPLEEFVAALGES